MPLASCARCWRSSALPPWLPSTWLVATASCGRRPVSCWTRRSAGWTPALKLEVRSPWGNVPVDKSWDSVCPSGNFLLSCPQLLLCSKLFLLVRVSHNPSITPSSKVKVVDQGQRSLRFTSVLLFVCGCMCAMCATRVVFSNNWVVLLIS